VFQAVHSDRSGRVFVSADYGATALDGPAPAALDRAIPLPADAELVPLADREAIGIDRRGLPRPLGPARWAVAAILRPGHLRTHLPACDVAGGSGPLEPLGYAAVAADARGELVVAAIAFGPTAPAPAEDLAAAITRRLRAEPSSKLLRQLARCARDYTCRYAANAFLGTGECALPVGGAANDEAAPLAALRRRDERAPLEPVSFKADAEDVAAVAVTHLAAGGACVSFGHACEGDPLTRVRTVSGATERIRRERVTGEVVLRTSGASAAALGRAADAGVSRVVVRIASAHGPTYERVHRPSGFRWSDVLASLRAAAGLKLAITVELLVLPGLTDRESEVRAIVGLLGELPAGTELRLADLAADPYALLARIPGGATIGVAALVARLRADASHVRLAA
jgi:hypothetical protein